MSLILCESAVDFDRFVAVFRRQALSVFPHVTEWLVQSTPREYPCLVDFYADSVDRRLVGFYVYRSDAAKLIAHGGAVPAAGATGPVQADHNRHVSAHLLTVVHFLCETGICKEKQYELKLDEFLARVDQWTAEDRDQIGGVGRRILTALTDG